MEDSIYLINGLKDKITLSFNTFEHENAIFEVNFDDQKINIKDENFLNIISKYADLEDITMHFAQDKELIDGTLLYPFTLSYENKRFKKFFLPTIK